MSHEPPVPQANQSPYPLHPKPLSEEAKAAMHAARKTTNGSGTSALPSITTGVAAIIGVAAVSLVSGALWVRRGKRRPSSLKPGLGRLMAKTPLQTLTTKRDEQYGITYFARKHGITAKVAREIIAEAGASRSAANALAKKRSAG